MHKWRILDITKNCGKREIMERKQIIFEKKETGLAA